MTDGAAVPEVDASEDDVTEKVLVVHGHFYQPPREFPGTDDLPIEPTASPWHDWNARINAECYHPNTAASVLDAEGRILQLVSNFEHLSFNVGPTLLSWMQRHAPVTYQRIIAAGRAGRGAIAQGFNHCILPLCNERDKQTQVRWGLADFRHRFGFESEGFWLPECAVDDATLRVLTNEGLRFTLLAPYQIDPPGPGVARWKGGDIALVSYDGVLSGDLAFGSGSMTSEALIDRIVVSSQPIVVVATDGETFGHHHHFADRMLAHALTDAAAARGVRVANAADVVRQLTMAPTTMKAVAVRESAWSCAHGVERWRSDCGCSGGRGVGWHQRWRGPLRDALDVLRDAAADIFERRGAPLVVDADPWAVRDAYVDVVIGATPWVEFARLHAVKQPEIMHPLLEAQRAAMAMYTSCGWFFDDIAGVEARIVLRWANALVQHLRSIDERLPEDRFAEILTKAQGNAGLDGNDVWTEVQGEAPPIPTGDDRRPWAPTINPRDIAVASVIRMLNEAGAIPDDAELAAISRELGISPAARTRSLV